MCVETETQRDPAMCVSSHRTGHSQGSGLLWGALSHRLCSSHLAPLTERALESPWGLFVVLLQHYGDIQELHGCLPGLD